jgi:hypothetical protein
MGLVGFHLMSKTPSAPQWFWSTFEQEGNAPGACPGPTSRRIPPYTYWNPAQGQRDVNQQTKERIPNQICRVYPISNSEPNCSNPLNATDNVQALNKSVQGALAKTPLVHYQLVNTRRPVLGSSPVGGSHTQFDVLPRILGNTTLESFIQGTSSNVSPSNPDGQAFFSSDFTFALGLAQPAPAPPPLLRGLSSKAELLPAPYFHVVFTLHRPIPDIAYQNKAVIYGRADEADAVQAI